ncbi:hypothetical protein HRbin39_00028 [bacterium HR39]|nr:hypothetical protein HRbin39_00028 [bacterium HR39]
MNGQAPQGVIELLTDWGVLPDVSNTLARIQFHLKNLGAFDALQTLAGAILLGLVGIRLLQGTARLRGQIFLSTAIRGAIAGALLAAAPALQEAAASFFIGAVDTSITISDRLFEYNLALSRAASDVITVGAGAMGIATVGVMGNAARKVGEKALEKGITNTTVVDMAGAGTKGATESVGKFAAYLNIFAIALIPLLLLLAVLQVTAGVGMLVALMFLPAIIPFLVMNGHGVTAQFFQPLYRAIIGGAFVVLLAPIVLGAAALIAFGIPAEQFGQAWNYHVSALENISMWNIGEGLKHVGALIWAIVRLLLSLVFGVILAFYVTLGASRFITQFVGGIAGLVGDMAGLVRGAVTGKTAARTSTQAALATGSAAKSAAAAAGRTAVGLYALNRVAYQTARTAYADYQARKAPVANSYTISDRRPVVSRPLNPQSMTDYWHLKEGETARVVAKPPLVAEDPGPPPPRRGQGWNQLPPPKEEGDEERP